MSLPQIGAVTGPPGFHGVEKQNPLFPGGGQVTLQTSGRGELWRPRTWETRPVPVGMSWAECDPA